MAGPNLRTGDFQNLPFGERMHVTSHENAGNQVAAQNRSAGAGQSKAIPGKEETRNKKQTKN
jgi:hypothetical protein